MTSSTSLFNQQMSEFINPFSATNMINRNLMNEAVKKQFERKSNSYSSLSYSTSLRDFSPGTPASRAVEKKLKSMPNHAHLLLKPAVNITSTSNQFNFTKLLISYFTR